LLRLIERAEVEDAPTDALRMIASVLEDAEDIQANWRLLQMLQAARDRRPADYFLQHRIAWSSLNLWWATGDARLVVETLGGFRTVIALRSEKTDGHYLLGTALGAFGDDAQAVRYLREAIARNPTYTFAHINLATALYRLGASDGAEKVLREAIQLDSSFGRAIMDLGHVLWSRGNFQAAVEQYQKACLCDPQNASRPYRTITALRQTGQFAGATAVGRAWSQAVGKDHRDRAKIEKALQLVERAAQAEAKVPLLLAGQDPAADNEERILLAERCLCLRHEPAAARLYAAALTADPSLSTISYPMAYDDIFIRPRETSHHYHAALAAARAGCGLSTDAARLTPAERAALRVRALEWLRAELAVHRKLAGSPVWSEKQTAALHLPLWLGEPAFAGLRPGSAGAEQTPAEQTAWDAFWDEVHDTLTLARQPPPPGKKAGGQRR
jgi:tetratricopeptide (TPR) repeat protein